MSEPASEAVLSSASESSHAVDTASDPASASTPSHGAAAYHSAPVATLAAAHTATPNPAPVEVFGHSRVRAIGGGPLLGALLFRSCELVNIDAQEAAVLVGTLGIRSIYDIRNQWEVAAHAEPCLIGAKTVALEPATERRSKDASKRLVAGVIGAYGAPEERMSSNYRRYVREYPLIGTALRAIAAEGVPALVHCVNGKDRTGVLCAVLLRAAGAHPDDIMADYLATNQVNAAQIEREVAELGASMTDNEYAILRSFLEARPAYLQAFFDEVNAAFGSFEHYVTNGLRLAPLQRARLATMLSRS